MRILFILLLLLAFPFSSIGQMVRESPSQVWEVGDRRWTIEEEQNYSQWVETTMTEDFFIRHKIPVDCADVPYAVRWIYARIARLPAAATTKDGKLIGHWSTEWGKLPTHSEWDKDPRFRRVLLHVLTETTTRTLPYDTYPTQITPDAVTPGTTFFVTESHSGIISHVILDGSHAHPLQTWESTVPAKIQKLNQKNFLSPRPESTIYSGLVKFRWPVVQNGQWKYLPSMEHPFYSEEQYQSTFYEECADFTEAVAKRIDPTAYDPWEKVDRVIDTIIRSLLERGPIVSEGYRQCRKGGCPEGSSRWEIHSTPGRDGMITLLIEHLSQVMESNALDKDRLKEKMEAIWIPISEVDSVTLYHIYQNYLWLSPHPGDSIEARWGMKKCDMILAQTRSAKSSIAFIEKTYRRKDPKYANFAVQQQEEIVRRLMAEWGRSACVEPPPSKKKKGVGGI